MTQTEGRERRAALLREFEISGLSLAEFCRRAGLAYSTAQTWRRKAREAGAPSRPVFVEVEALEPEAEAAPQACPDGSAGAGERDDHCGVAAAMERDGAGQGLRGRRPPGGAPPSWRVELELPGGLTLRICGDFLDRGGGGGSPPAASGKGGAS
jgi:hypothetical protein